MRAFSLIAAAVAVMFSASFANADSVNFSVEGIASWDAPGDADNLTFTVEVGAADTLTGVSWDVGIDPQGASWYSEANFAFEGITVTPSGDQEASDGGPRFYESGGVQLFADLGIADVALTDSNGDGSNDITLEFFESFDDADGVIDAFWLDGTAGTNPSGLGGIDFHVSTVPEPSSAVLITLLGLGFARRRNR